MKLEEAKRVIEEYGYKVQEVEALKGSCMVQGLSIGEGTVRPTVYASAIKDMDDGSIIDVGKIDIADRYFYCPVRLNVCTALAQ